MHSLKILTAALALIVISSATPAQQPANANEVVDKIVAQEHAEVELLRKYTPLV